MASRLAPFVAGAAAFARRFEVRLAIALITAAALASATGAGAYLERTAFYHPYLKLRAAVGLAPDLDPRVRFIFLDDRSLRHRHGVSELRRLAAHDGLRERRLSSADLKAADG